MTLLAFAAAALLIALSPGPGIFYVAARTLAGGRREGFASTLGTGLGGLVHVAAGAIGISALILASAELFTALKLIGAIYLVWLGIRTFREASPAAVETPPIGARRAFRDGIVVEAANPKTAAFFLAFIPQFIDPAAAAALQFALLGLVSVALNTAVDALVVLAAARARTALATRPTLIHRTRQASALFLCGLGLALAVARRPA